MYNIKSLTDKYRVPSVHGVAFDVCEHCGYDSSIKDTAYNVRYYHRYGLALCDRCVDKSNYNGENYWEDEDAARSGFPVPFKYPAPEVIEKNVEDLEQYKKDNRFKYYENK